MMKNIIFTRVGWTVDTEGETFCEVLNNVMLQD